MSDNLFGFEIGEHVVLNETLPGKPWEGVGEYYQYMIKELREGTPTIKGPHGLTNNIMVHFSDRDIGVPYHWLISAETQINTDDFEKLL